jgi:hypothetical protein
MCKKRIRKHIRNTKEYFYRTMTALMSPSCLTLGETREYRSSLAKEEWQAARTCLGTTVHPFRNPILSSPWLAKSTFCSSVREESKVAVILSGGGIPGDVNVSIAQQDGRLKGFLTFIL